jgi:nucleotide-binding universal stress UspA family protein
MTDPPAARAHDGPILLCAGTDAEAAGRLAVAAGALVTDRPVVVLAIWEPPPIAGGYDPVRDALNDAYAELRMAARRAATAAATAACDVLDADGLNVTRRICSDGRSPWRVIVQIADEIDAALIVAGAGEGSGRDAGTLGRQARALAHRSRRPLLVLPADGSAAAPGASAVFAYDGSAPAAHAAGVATTLLAPRPAFVACVWRSAAAAVGAATLALPDEVARAGADALDAAARREAEAHARDAATQLSAAAWSCDLAAVRTARNVSTAIIHTADEREAAVVVTGTRGRSRLAAALLGSSAEGILRHAGRPVLLVPPAQPD